VHTNVFYVYLFQVMPPQEDRIDFRNRHGTLSINTMLVIGASGKFHYCGSSTPGSQHDSTIFKESDLFTRLHDEQLVPLEGGILVGDSAYKTTWPFLCTPFLDAIAATNARQRAFNLDFCRCRVHIEQGIGRLKNRWPILSGGGIKFPDMEKSSKLIQGEHSNWFLLARFITKHLVSLPEDHLRSMILDQ
jgi:hypothetical protein